jgi:hypothetical protein
VREAKYCIGIGALHSRLHTNNACPYQIFFLIYIIAIQKYNADLTGLPKREHGFMSKIAEDRNRSN